MRRKEGSNTISPDPGPRGRTAIAATLILALAAWAALGRVPLPPLDPDGFISGYGVTDNRLLLLRYAGLLAAAVLGPLAALGWERWRGRSLRPDPVVLDLDRPARSLARPWVHVAAMGLLFYCFVGPGVAMHPLNGHELVHLGYLNEIEHGRLLNVDTRVTYGPLLGYSIWGFMKLVSFDLVGFRFYWNMTAAIGLGALLFLGSRILESRALWILLMLYLALHSVARLFLPDAEGVNGGLWGWGNFLRHGWATLFILIFARRFIASRSPWSRIAAGAIAALGAVYAQETASGGVAALGLLLLAARGTRPWRSLVPDAAMVVAGAALVLAATAYPAFRRGELGSFVQAGLEIPRLFLDGGGNEPYPRLLGTDRHGHPAWAGYYLFPALLLASLASLWWLHLQRKTFVVALPLAGYAAVSFVTVLVRADGLHLLNVAVAPIVLGFILADRGQRRMAELAGEGGGRARARWARLVLPAAFVVPLLVLRPGLVELATGVAGRFAHPVPSPPEGWEAIPGDRGGVWTPRGDWFDAPDWGGGDNPETAPFIRAATGGRPTYIRGNKASLYYFLADVPCAASYTDLSSQCLTPAAYARLFRELAERPPEMVFLMEKTIGPRPRPQDGYRFLGVYHGLEAFQRMDLPPPSGPLFMPPQ